MVEVENKEHYFEKNKNKKIDYSKYVSQTLKLKERNKEWMDLEKFPVEKRKDILDVQSLKLEENIKRKQQILKNNTFS